METLSKEWENTEGGADSAELTMKGGIDMVGVQTIAIMWEDVHALLKIAIA